MSPPIPEKIPPAAQPLPIMVVGQLRASENQSGIAPTNILKKQSMPPTSATNPNDQVKLSTGKRILAVLAGLGTLIGGAIGGVLAFGAWPVLAFIGLVVMGVGAVGGGKGGLAVVGVGFGILLGPITVGALSLKGAGLLFKMAYDGSTKPIMGKSHA